MKRSKMHEERRRLELLRERAIDDQIQAAAMEHNAITETRAVILDRMANTDPRAYESMEMMRRHLAAFEARQWRVWSYGKAMAKIADGDASG